MPRQSWAGSAAEPGGPTGGGLAGVRPGPGGEAGGRAGGKTARDTSSCELGAESGLGLSSTSMPGLGAWDHPAVCPGYANARDVSPGIGGRLCGKKSRCPGCSRGDGKRRGRCLAWSRANAGANADARPGGRTLRRGPDRPPKDDGPCPRAPPHVNAQRPPLCSPRPCKGAAGQPWAAVQSAPSRGPRCRRWSDGTGPARPRSTSWISGSTERALWQQARPLDPGRERGHACSGGRALTTGVFFLAGNPSERAQPKFPITTAIDPADCPPFRRHTPTADVLLEA